MSLNPEATEALDRFFKGHTYIERDSDRQSLIVTFVDLFMGGSRVRIDDVREWAVDRGWAPRDVLAVGVLVDTIYYTLRRSKAIVR